MGAYIPAVEERLKASVLVAGGIDVVNARPRPEASETNYIPRVKIPTLMLNGRYDSFFAYDKSIKPMFDMLGTPKEDKVLKLYDTDHVPPKNEFVKETLAWFDKYLGPVKR
jgi:predicted alpha/beta-hydrolase family hydrolase